MKHAYWALFVFATALFGQVDRRIETVTVDLKALGRITSLAKNLYDTRQVMTAILDENVEQFREPQGDGTYRWASLQREEASRIKEERTADKVQSESELTKVTVSASKAYRAVINVPRKRGVFAENNQVYVRNVIVEWTAFNGRRNQQDIPIDVWIKPGDSHGVALPEIGKSVKVVAHVGVEKSDKRAVVEVALLQAKLVDDPANPNFPVVRRLLGIRALLEKDQIKRSDLKTAVDDAILALPGELQKRFSESEAEAAQRLERARSGQMRGSVSFGDATPDVVAQLEEIGRLLSGNYEEQSRAREKIQALIELLRAPTPTP